MGVPIIYRKQGESSIASYDYTDIASGPGYITLYGADDYLSGGLLVDNPVYSDKIVTYCVPTSTTNYPKEIDKNFDVTFNKNIVIKGKAMVNFSMQVSAGTSASGYPMTKISKISEGVETILASSLSGALITYTHASTSWDRPKMYLFGLELPQVTFAKGDKLRVNVQAYAKYSGASPYVAIAHDPKSRTDSTFFTATGDVSQMSIQLPVKIDL